MAALTITASAIVPDPASANYGRSEGIAAATITQGQAVYRLAAGTIGLADANGASPLYVVAGVSLTSALAGQPVLYQTGGQLAFGAILTAGKYYVVGGTAAGDIAPIADLASGWYTSVIGFAVSTSIMQIAPLSTGVVNA